MKSLGQHFLKNPALIQKIIAALDSQPGETIFEIGPGHGELTIPLAEACGKIDASERGSAIKIIAVEKDAKLADALLAKLATLGIKNVEVLPGDALIVLQSNILGLAAGEPFKIVGNIPYYITGHLLRVISELAAKPERCIFMIQTEVAERIIAEPPKMNRLAASVQFWAEPKIIARVPKTDFSPPPEVDSALIQLDVQLDAKKFGIINPEQYYSAVRALFAQPRKTILNNLAASVDLNEASRAKDKKKLSESLIAIEIIPESRPQNLTVENIAAIAENFFAVHKLI